MLSSVIQRLRLPLGLRGRGATTERPSFLPPPLEPAPTGIAAFLGMTAKSNVEAGFITSFAEFTATYGPLMGDAELGYAVRGFFENGGTRCFIAPMRQSGILGVIEQAPDISLLAFPEEHNPALDRVRCDVLRNGLLEMCARRRDRFVILAAPPESKGRYVKIPPVLSPFAALYHPWALVAAPGGTSRRLVPPVGHIAGLYARIDRQKGVHTAPAGAPLKGILGLAEAIDSVTTRALNQERINVLRDLGQKHGIQAWGAKTLSDDPDWRYVQVRRLAIFIEASIQNGMKRASERPFQRLGMGVETIIVDFLETLRRKEALKGERPWQAYFVRREETSERPGGRLSFIIGFAPLNPSQFVIQRIAAPIPTKS